jgi:hypothetical protein
MSLKQFLVVSKSFIGIRDAKSPYELRKENLLPRFGSSGRIAPAAYPTPMVQADWLEPRTLGEPVESVAPQPKPFEAALPPSTPFASPAPGASSHPAKARLPRGWLNLLTFGLLGRRKESSSLVQSELSLDRIKVIRNDLADSDLELVIRRKKKKAQSKTEAPPAGDNPQPWSRLTARLFEIGQEH